MHPGWTLYALVGTAVLGIGLTGMFAGLRNGSVRIDFEEDTPEARTEAYWALWGLFSGLVSSAILWPLSLPGVGRIVLRALKTGVFPTLTITRLENPFRHIDEDRMKEIFVDLRDQWRQSRPERVGDPYMVSVFMNAAAIEGRAAFRDWPEKEGRVALVAAFKSVLDGPVNPAE